MNIIIASDIYGQTTPLETLANKLVRCGVSITIIDPYQGVNQHFSNEQQAYQTFMEKCGHVNYTELLMAQIKANNDTVIIGFSAGASAAYKAIDRVTVGGSADKIKHLIGFYPSQIRHHLDVKPACPVTIVFPAKEDHFDLDKVIKALSQRPLVSCIKTRLSHGFMNYHSNNYCQQAANEYTDILSRVDVLLDVGETQKLMSLPLS